MAERDPQFDAVVDEVISEAHLSRGVLLPEEVQYIREHALEMSDEVMQAHIDLYVNSFSLDVGEEGERAVRELHRRAVEVGATRPSARPLFVE